MRPIPQEHLMGCGIACSAFAAKTSYSKALSKFDKRKASTTGYYLKDMIKGLKKLGLNYSFKKASSRNKHLLKKEGTIVFIKRCKKYPEGHYIIKIKKGWMNPWINYPLVNPVKAGINKKLPGTTQWILYT